MTKNFALTLPIVLSLMLPLTSLEASRIVVNVDATETDGRYDIFYLIFPVEPNNRNSITIKREEGEAYKQLSERVLDEGYSIGRVESAEIKLVDGGFGSKFFLAWRPIRVPRNYYGEERIIQFAEKVEESTPYTFSYFPAPLEQLSAEQLNKIFSSAEREGRRLANKIARAQGKQVGELVETKWINSERLTGLRRDFTNRVLLQLTFSSR